MSAKPLVNIANRVTPPDPLREIRRRKFALRKVAARIMPKERVAKCGAFAMSGVVDIRLGKNGRAHYAGVETCGSVWMCPVCAAKVSEERRKEVEKAMTRHMDGGGAVYMAALTVPHHRFQKAGELKQGVADLWRRVLQGDPWKRFMGRIGGMGYIRALEVTYGENGWHPHLHVLILTEKPLDDEKRFLAEEWLFERWAKFVEKADFGECLRGIFKLEECERPASAGDYVAKWGADSELTKGHMKTARSGGRSPWHLLDDAGKGDKEAERLFYQYACAFKGARQLTWSGGLKRLYGVCEKEDDAIARAEEAAVKTICSITSRMFRRLVRKGLLAEALEAAEDGGKKTLTWFVQKKGLNDVEADGGATFSVAKYPGPSVMVIARGPSQYL